MTDLLKLTGDTAFGKFDYELGALHPGIVAETKGGRSRYTVKSNTTVKVAGKSALGNVAHYYFGIWIDPTGNPSGASQAFVHCLNSGGSNAFRIRRGSTGTVILDGATTNGLDTSPVVPTAPFILIGDITADLGTLTIYAADGTTVLDTLTAAGTGVFGALDNWRMGQMAGSPAIPEWGFRLLVRDTPVTAADMLVNAPPVAGERQAMIGHSLLAMSGANGSYVYSDLLDQGFDPRNVYFWGVGGKRISIPNPANANAKTSMQNVQDARALLGTVDTFLIYLGQNDVTYTDAEVNGYIDTLLAEIGAGPKVIWINLSALQSVSADGARLNGLIQAKLAARPNSVYTGWDSYIRSVDGGANPSPLWDVDGIHMTPLGYQTVLSPYLVEQLVEDSPEPPDPSTYAGTSNSSLEIAWLRKVTATVGIASLSDLRKSLYNGDEKGYWAARSGLSFGSLSDHKLAAMKLDTGATGSLADVSRVYWAKNSA